MSDWLAERLTLLIPLWLSLSVHEWAHAYVAFRLGDDTAERLGRMTVNPLAHVDPVGTFLLPMLGIPFGWAKPVPINPTRFDRKVSMGTGFALSAAAGPLSNFALAVASVLGLVVVTHLAPGGASPAVVTLLYTFALINVALGIFNLFPIPPLDGSRIAEALVPYRFRGAWDAYASLAPVMLVGLIALPALLNVSLVEWPMREMRALLDGVIAARN